MKREKKVKRKFLSMGRREFVEIALFGAAWAYLRHVPDFTIDKISRTEDQSKQIDLNGNFMWHDKYNAEFVQKYYNIAKSLRNTFNFRFLDNIINHPFPIEKYRLSKEPLAKEIKKRNIFKKGIIKYATLLNITDDVT